MAYKGLGLFKILIYIYILNYQTLVTQMAERATQDQNFLGSILAWIQ